MKHVLCLVCLLLAACGQEAKVLAPAPVELNFSGKPITDADLANLPTGVTTLRLDRTQVTDTGLAHLLKYPHLVDLAINFCPISDEGAKTIGQMKQLKRLDLIGTKVTDRGLDSLPGGLESFQVGNPKGYEITDQVVNKLKRFPNLRRFNAYSRAITEGGYNQIRAIVPPSPEDDDCSPAKPANQETPIAQANGVSFLLPMRHRYTQNNSSARFF